MTREYRNKVAKTDWLTIPDAPNYEINGFFKVRNKKTGRILSKKKRVGKQNVVTTLFANGKQVKRDVKTFYRQAVLSALEDKFEWHRLQPPLTNYEINGFGAVRNARTKRAVKPIRIRGGVYYHLSVNDKTVHCNPNELLAEILGTPVIYKKNAVPVVLRKDKCSWYFKSIEKAAVFLSGKVYYCVDTIRKLLGKRQSEIYGYSVTYLGKSYSK